MLCASLSVALLLRDSECFRTACLPADLCLSAHWHVYSQLCFGVAAVMCWGCVYRVCRG